MKRFVAVFAVCCCLASRDAEAGLAWQNESDGCEPPDVFYDPLQHQLSMPPCCPLVAGVCPRVDGDSENPSSTCEYVLKPPPDQSRYECKESGVACVPTAMPGRPNVVLFITDDQASCAYGEAGECYSNKSARPIPAAHTPYLDALAQYGTVFPIAHNTANWCTPSVNGIITARYQKNFAVTSRPDRDLTTYPMALRSLGEHPNYAGGTRDEYDPDGLNVVGGYCTYFAGKYIPLFANASARGRGQGDLRFQCSGAYPTYLDCQTGSFAPLAEFLHSMKFENPVTHQPDVQPFFVWHFPFLPHAKMATPDDRAVEFDFGPHPAPYPDGGLFQLGGRRCGSGLCTGVSSPFEEKDKSGNTHQYFGSTWLADRNLGEIAKLLKAEGLQSNTVIIHVSDNPWFLWQSKKHFSENGYRTRLIVYDPRVLPSASDVLLATDDPSQSIQRASYAGRLNPDPAHSNDILPTVLHLITESPGPAKTECPSTGATPCDGRDLVPYLMDASGDIPGLPGRPHLRNSLCGHDTANPVRAAGRRFIITAPHRTGRCYLPVPQAPQSCPAGSAPGSGPYAGYCEWNDDVNVVDDDGMDAGAPCSNPNGACNPVGGGAGIGGLCLGGQCRAAPACLENDDCVAMWNDPEAKCVLPDDPATPAREGHVGWCRNAPNKACDTHGNCPDCAAGHEACQRVCMPRVLKFYVAPPVSGAIPATALTDLLLDPNELHDTAASIRKKPGLLVAPDPGTVAYDMSGLVPHDPVTAPLPYDAVLERLNCCVDAWWPDNLPALQGSRCTVSVGQRAAACGDLVCEDG